MTDFKHKGAAYLAVIYSDHTVSNLLESKLNEKKDFANLYGLRETVLILTDDSLTKESRGDI